MAAQIKALQLRIASTKNIGKITKSMKMVAASKLRGDQMRLEAGLPFGEALLRCVVPEESRPAFGRKPTKDEEEAHSLNFNTDAGKTLFVGVTSDKGLCGGVNSSISKAIKAGVKAVEDEGKEGKILTYGEKCRALLQRDYGENLTYTIDENWKDPSNFAKTSALAERIVAQEQDQAYVFYNRFINSIQYTTTRIPLPNFGGPTLELPNGTENTEGEPCGPAQLRDYECEDECREECMQNLYEFATAGILHMACLDNATAEQSSRMAAMDNATNNANDMIQSLELKRNRARQAAITTELIEIISGASALDDA
jgi:F-type H+-transporting ATPase subunit gamma